MRQMTRRLVLAGLMLVPLTALAAISSAHDRFAAAGDYLPGSNLSTRFGRMAMSGDFVPGGSGAAGPSTGATSGRFNWIIFGRKRR